MRVLVTGGSGWIGSAVVPELLGAGHHVIGLARSDESASALSAAGAQVKRGSLEDLYSLRDGAAAAEGVVHLAFRHDLAFSGDFVGATESDRLAIETIGETLVDSGRPFVIASGIVGIAPGRVMTEDDGHDPDDVALFAGGRNPRLVNAELTLALAARGVRSSVLRLPPTVHGDGDKGFLPALIGIARAKGFSGYIGEGANRWPAVARLDASRLFRLALEQAPAGSTLHAIGDQGVSIREIAEVIGRHLDIPARSVAPQDAADHFGWLADFLAADSPASSDLTRELLGWEPTRPGLLDDLEEGHYFSSREPSQ